MSRHWPAWIIFFFLLTACAPDVPIPLPAPPPSPTPVPGLQPAIDGGLTFLTAQFNPAYGLLQESPNIGQHRYYLTNDNALAAYVLAQLGDSDFAQTLRRNLDRYGYHDNDFVEVAWGEVIPWPPLHHRDLVVQKLSDRACDFLNVDESEPVGDCIFQETHTPDLGVFYDWSSFSNLACMGAVNEVNKGSLDVARWLYRNQISIFDGQGWPDEAWRRRGGVYETIGLTWCLYAGALLGEPVNQQVLTSLLAQQDLTSGGFHTHYQANADRLADPNVETTSLAILALSTLNGTRRLGSPSPVLGFPADSLWLIPVASPAPTPTAVSSAAPTPAPIPTSIPGLQPAVDGGLRFLAEQFNPSLSLLRESRIVRFDTYWLATDNLLATYALDAVGAAEMARDVRAGLGQYGDVHHGLIEALIGESVDWPPHVETQSEVVPPVKTEQRMTGPQYEDWADYADLALYGALVAHNAGDDDLARSLYGQALAQFDGVGFSDKAYTERDGEPLYATYKVALAVYVGSTLGRPLDPVLLQALLAKQEAETGGFITLYDAAGVPRGDANTETTSYAILALARLR